MSHIFTQLRSAGYYVGLVLVTSTFGLALALAGWAMSPDTCHRVTRQWARSNLWMLKVICRLDFDIEGAEHLPQGAAIIMAKHQSAWETIALRAIVRLQQSWVLKKELMKIPLFGLSLALTNPIPIDRAAGREAIRQLVEQGRARLDQGMTVMLFPEGTRTPPGERRRYHIGGGVLAAETGYPVIPIAHNAGVFWPRRRFAKQSGQIRVVIGAPIDSRGRKAADIVREVEAWIETTQSRLPSTPGPKSVDKT